MEQENIPEDIQVKIDFDDLRLSEAVRRLQPLVFNDGNGFRCLLGPDEQEGIVGNGETAEAALEDWEANMRKRIIYPRSNDQVISFVVEKLNSPPK